MRTGGQFNAFREHEQESKEEDKRKVMLYLSEGIEGERDALLRKQLPVSNGRPCAVLQLMSFPC